MARSIKRAGITAQVNRSTSDTRRTAEPVPKVLSLSKNVDEMGSRKIAAAAQAVAQISNPTRLVLEYQYRLSRRCVIRTGMLKSCDISYDEVAAANGSTCVEATEVRKRVQ